MDDRGAFFGWGVEYGHLGKTEIFYKFDSLNDEAQEAVVGWENEQSMRALNERYFANTMVADDVVEHEIGPRLSNYHLWWRKVKEAIDPNGVTPEGGAIV